MRISTAVRAVLVLTVLAVGGGTSYLAYARLSLYPPAEATARRFLGHLFRGEADAAYDLLAPASRLSITREAFGGEVAQREVVFSGVRQVALAGLELEGVTRISLHGPVTYAPGVTGEATVALACEELGWRVTAYDVQCPVLLDRLREEALRVGGAFLDAIRGGEFAALTATLHPETVRRMGEGPLKALQRGFSRRVEDARFIESRSRVEFPRYLLRGALRTADGPPYDIDLQLTWAKGEIRVTDFRFEPSAVWLVEQKNVARQVALNFVAAMKAGSAADMIRNCHPKLVEALGAARFDEMAADFVYKLQDITFDEAHSTARHPLYEIGGVQRTQAGTTVPALIRVQHVDGTYMITGIQFD